MQSDESQKLIPKALLLGLVLWCSVCVVFVFWDTLRLPYAFDDLDQLHALARMRTGQWAFGDWLWRPHNEHTVPLLRILFAAATHISGLDASAFRVMLVLIHVFGAVACGVLAYNLSGRPAAAWMAGTFYAGAGGFAGSPVWEPTIAVFSLSATFLGLVFLCFAGPWSEKRLTFAAAIVFFIAAWLSLPAAAAAGLAVPVYIIIVRPRLAVPRLHASAVFVGLAVLLLVLSRWNMSRFGANPDVHLTFAGARNAAWLVWTAPFRFLAGWLPMPVLDVRLILIGSGAVWVVLWVTAALSKRLPWKVLVALSFEYFFLCALVGIGRSSNSVLTLYLTDRYYYYALLPLSIFGALLLVAVWHSIRVLRRLPQPVIAAVLLPTSLAALAVAQRNLNASLPWGIYGFHRDAWVKAKPLVSLLAARAASETPNSRLTLVDGAIPFSGVHKGSITLSCLVYTEFPAGIPGTVWSKGNPARSKAGQLNSVLDGWAAALATSSPVCVEDGRLVDVRETDWIDFRSGAYEQVIVDGFHKWEGTYRWMEKTGSLRVRRGPGRFVVRVHVPLDLIRKRWLEIESVDVSIKIDGVPVGGMTVSANGQYERGFELPASIIGRTKIGDDLNVVLESSVAWRGVDLNPPLRDEREISIALVAIGFPAASSHGRTRSCASRLHGK